jgi:DNA invertase Pin-like site-specific DNA recombinase
VRIDGYIRVSQVGDREGESFISPDVQREQIAAWARANGHEVVAWHEDLNQSGGTIDRPGFQEALRRIEAGETDGLAVAKLDRFARSAYRAHQAIARIQEAGGQFVSVAEQMDLSTSAGKLQFNMLASVAQFQRDQMIETWDVSNAQAIGRGIHFTNSVPLGYRRREDKRLEPDPATAEHVRDLFLRRAGGESWRSLADWLTGAAPREDGRRWGPRNIATMIQSRVYLGVAFHGKHENPDAHEPLVTQAEWEAANVVKGGPGAIRKTSALLAGVIRCAGCRYAMRHTFTYYRDGRKVRIYSCGRSFTGGKCSAPATIVAEHAEAVVVEQVLVWFGAFAWTSGEESDGPIIAARRQRDHARERLEAILADDTLRDAAGDAAYYAEVGRRREAVERAEREAAEAEAQRVADERRRYVLDGEWERMTHETRAHTVRTVIDSIYVRKQRGGEPRERVLIRWAGEDRFERPRRGSCKYVIQPIPWPDLGLAEREGLTSAARDLALANVPEWAWRLGHPALPEESRGLMHEVAEEMDLPWYLPDAMASPRE